MSKDILVVENLIKSYKKAHTNAVNDISFSVKEGEFFAFLGPNGAGKTTTISILTTTLSKTAGDVKIAGFDLEKDASSIRQNVGIIFQNPSLDLNLTAEENIRFHAILYGLYPFRPSFRTMPKDYQDRVMELAGILGIKDNINQPVKTYSGGMKRKLEILRSLMHGPKILFLDEPTTGLDPLSRRNLWEYLKTVRETQGTTIFLTTHYLEEAEGADHVVIINHGKIVADGSPEEIKNRLVEEYILLETDQPKQLQEELIRLGLNFTAGKPFRVECAGRTTQEIIKSIDTKLTKIDIHRPTLEEAYVDITNEDTEK